MQVDELELVLVLAENGFALSKTANQQFIFEYDVIVMSQTPFPHSHWEAINRVKRDICTCYSFGGSKAH